MRFARVAVALVTSAWLAVGCTCGEGLPVDPTDVDLGSTAVVVAVNPAINTANSAAIPTPGSQRSGVAVSLAGRNVSSSASGLAVFGNLDGGTHTLRVGGGSVPLTIVDRQLREIAVAQSGGTAAVMADVIYPFSGLEVVEVDAGLSAAQLAAVLNGSNRIVLVRGGTYTGNVSFNGSNVILFGEGASGGKVTIDGNVTVNGSSNRIRGTRITGTLAVDGSDFALTFSRVNGHVTATGGSLVLLHNVLCDGGTFPGGNLTMLGNEGLAPLAAPDGGC